jgi:hypothetical protein
MVQVEFINGKRPGMRLGRTSVVHRAAKKPGGSRRRAGYRSHQKAAQENLNAMPHRPASGI